MPQTHPQFCFYKQNGEDTEKERTLPRESHHRCPSPTDAPTLHRCPHPHRLLSLQSRYVPGQRPRLTPELGEQEATR